MERKEPEWLNAEAPKDIAQSSHYDLGQRLIFVTSWLEKSGLSQDEIMLGYFNECLRVATTDRGIMGAYIMVTRLHEHIVQLLQKLYAASHSLHLDELPADSTVKQSNPE
jgi:hypothetical protein